MEEVEFGVEGALDLSDGLTNEMEGGGFEGLGESRVDSSCASPLRLFFSLDFDGVMLVFMIPRPKFSVLSERVERDCCWDFTGVGVVSIGQRPLLRELVEDFSLRFEEIFRGLLLTELLGLTMVKEFLSSSLRCFRARDRRIQQRIQR